ncbi:hypothetical protein C8J56DRAFT_90617 [Mycena floridula]|nr:hypothetical protein C8J56DRAFT_90617 [Mycena floridula]
MSVATPTVLPRGPRFPHLLPSVPTPHPVPLRQSDEYGYLNAHRDLQREMDELEEEENELEDLSAVIRDRGYTFLIPIGRTVTLQEEKNDADDSDGETESARSGGPASVIEEDEVDTTQDMDASMEDLDNEDEDDEDAEGSEEEAEAEPSSDP